MTSFLETLINTLALGSLYALVALGYTLVYGVLRFINFAHSDVVTLGAWVSFTIATALGWLGTGSPAFAMPLILVASMIICGAVGFTIEALAYRPLRKAPRINVLITAIGVSLLAQNAGMLDWAFGARPQSIRGLVSDAPLFHVGKLSVPTVDVVVVALTLALVLGLQWLVFGTKLGRAMRAVSFNEQVAALMGIDVNRVVSITFIIGSALAAAGGLLFAVRLGSVKITADTTWVLLGLKAFVAAVVGGIGNVRGAAAGALLIAAIEKFGGFYLSTGLADVYVFTVLILVLLFKPSGLFGKAVVEKV